MVWKRIQRQKLKNYQEDFIFNDPLKMNLYRRKIANDLVPTELPSKGPNDKHGPKTRPINRLPGSNLPFLQGPSRLPIRVRFKLFKILPLHSRSPNKNLTSSLESLSQYLRRSHRNQSLSHRLRLHLRSPPSHRRQEHRNRRWISHHSRLRSRSEPDLVTGKALDRIRKGSSDSRISEASSNGNPCLRSSQPSRSVWDSKNSDWWA